MNYFRSVGYNEESDYQSTSPAGKPKVLSVLFSLKKRKKVEVWGKLASSPSGRWIVCLIYLEYIALCLHAISTTRQTNTSMRFMCDMEDCKQNCIVSNKSVPTRSVFLSSV